MAALAMIETAPDPFAAVRAMNRMRRAGFVVRLTGTDLQIAPVARLSDAQRSYLRSHKAALVALLTDAETLAAALAEAGTAGLAWGEGTPADWSDDRLLAAGEVLYGDGRLVNRHERRHGPRSAPAFEEGPECPLAADAPEIASCAALNVVPMDREVFEERAESEAVPGRERAP